MTLKGVQILLISDYYDALLLLATVAVIAILLWMAYQYGLKKAIASVNIKPNEGLPDTPQQLNALINSLNDIIYEFNEDKLCLNVWFSTVTKRIVDPRLCVGKHLEDVLGYERALKFNNALDYVIANRKQATVEYISDYGTGQWYIAKLTPVFDRDGNYTSRISASVTDISEQKKYSEALKENTALLVEAQAVAKIGNWWYDDQTKECYWSESLFAILEIEKLPEGANEFDYYLSLVHPEERENYRQFLLTLHMDAQKQYEHRLITPNGNLKYIKVLKGDLIYSDDGSLKRIFGIIQDVTENKLSEKAIKRGRTELLEAQRIAKIGNWDWDVAAHKLSWSDEIAHIFEMEPGLPESLGLRRLLKYVHKNDKFILQHLFKSAANIPNYTCVFRIITTGGTIKYISVIIGNLLKNDDGSLRKITGTLQDVTERKLVEIDYKRTENKYRLVLETIKLIAITVNAEGIIIFCNQYLANLLGYNQKDIVGMNWFENFIPDSEKHNLIDFFGANAVPLQYINPIIGRNGEQRIISWQNTISYDENGQIKETTSIGEDITDQQKATQELIFAKELAEKSSRFKSDFLSIMSHEIRTPMNAVIGTTNLLLSEEPRPEQMEYLNILKFSGENLLAIINDILDYNKIEAGKLELNQLKFNIHHLAQKIKQSFYPKAAEKKLDIDLEIDKAVPEYIIGDQMRLSQILNNLVGNAIKFTHKGGIMIRLQAKPAGSGQANIKFLVSDTGIGIAPESHESIFDPFMQVLLSNTNNTGGTGLGLAITRRLINLHQSDITVVRELERGSEFSFTISFKLPETEVVNFADARNNPMLNLHGMNILVVDDNKMNLLIASRFLKKWQANVDEASNGELAVKLSNNKIYDLIIMDLQMPVMSGFEATAIIKKTNPDIPIVALTADAMPETYNKALEAGMCDYLTKPFVPAVFFEKVSKYYKQVI